MKKFTLLLCVLAYSAVMMAATPDVIITQVYGGGGNSGATYKSDFIELYNTTAADIDISGWSLQYAAAANITAEITSANTIVFPASTTIKAKNHYSIKCADGGGGVEWSAGTFDWEPTATLALGGTNGKVMLMKNSTRITPSTLSAIIDDPNFGDYVPFGTGCAPVYGSNMSKNLSATQGALRKSAAGIYQYTGDIGNDFELATPNPRKTEGPNNITPITTDFKVYANNNTIFVNGLNAPANISVYDITGKLIRQTASAEIPVATKGIFIVKVNGQAFKVINK